MRACITYMHRARACSIAFIAWYHFYTTSSSNWFNVELNLKFNQEFNIEFNLRFKQLVQLACTTGEHNGCVLNMSFAQVHTTQEGGC